MTIKKITPAPAPAPASEPTDVQPKLNADSFKNWKGNKTTRSEDEEKGITTDLPAKLPTSAYGRIRTLTHALLGKSAHTPQTNLDLLTDALNAKGRKISRTVYVAKTFELRFFFADAPKGEFTRINVETSPNPKDVKKTLGL